MKRVGGYLFWAGLAFVIIGGINDISRMSSYDADFRFPIWSPIGAALIGVAATLMIAGVIEDRLIEIREAIKRQGQ
ncbi:hypothetical protein [Caulobacter sp. DWP3-1-3b2]|uniref:hypothetical protein n=1 Tax=Caulobacter sp. DWP3-1-3b2 TaxID=2804643 RepID=UPI003CF26BC2